MAPRRGGTGLRLVAAACIVVWAVRFAPRMHIPAGGPAPTAQQLTVMTWNVDYENQRPAAIREALLATPASVVALQEAYANQIVEDAAIARRYPYRLPTGPLLGNGTVLLSAHPFAATGPTYDDYPQVLWARIDLGRGRTITVATAHPLPAELRSCSTRSALCYDPSVRDDQIGEVRQEVGPLIDAGGPVLLMGDFNVTDREPAYRALTQGLRDSAAVVGSAWQPTWMPFLPYRAQIPMLRIDYLLASPNLRPLSVSVDCTRRGSDHCSVRGTFAIL